jgi:glycosyltransferase involved in cell wall biosynthesis
VNCLIVGIFSPVINLCGGAEWVAVNIINALKKEGHQIIVLSDQHLNHNKFAHVFNRKMPLDSEIVFPFRFFSPTDYHNIYTDMVRCLMLKSKCDVIIDTFSNAIIPSTDVVYIHHPLLRLVETGLPHGRNSIYFSPYRAFLSSYKSHLSEKLILANSKFTAQAIKNEIGLSPQVLYPSVSKEILNAQLNFDKERGNYVTTVSRIAGEKNLEIIPQIAKLTSKDIKFNIVGLLSSEIAFP